MNGGACPFAVGDTLRNANPHALAQKVKVTEVSVKGFAQDFFKADVIEGANTKEPLTVYRAGWWLYEKETSQ